MTTIKRWVVCTIAVAVVLVSASGRAQVLQQVPSNAWVVLKINNLKAVSDKIGKLSQDLGLVAMQPALADPMAMLQGGMGLKQGLNANGEFAVAMVDPASVGGDTEKAFLMFVPVSDYKSFLANSPNATTEGEISQVQFASEPMFAANWGQYAVLSPAKDLVSKKPAAALKAPSATSKELASKDAVFYANFDALRAKLLPGVQQGRPAVLAQLQQAIGNSPQATKLTPVLKAVVSQMFNIAEGYLNEAQAATFGLTLGTDGLGMSWVAEFKPGGYVTQNLTSEKNSDGSLLGGLPDGKYLIYGGAVSDPQRSLKVVSDLIDPVVKELLAVGPEMAPVQDIVSALKAQLSARTGQTFGMVAPSGQLGAEAIVQFVLVQRGDAKGMTDSIPKAIDAENKLFKALNLPNLQGMSPTYKANAKSIDGVAFNAIGVDMPANPQTPQARQQQQAMAIMYGPNGPTYYYGIVGDKVVMVSGTSDQVIKNAIASAKSNAAPLEAMDGFKEVSGQLPKQRLGVVYIDVAQITTTTLSYLKQFGFAMPLQLPPGLPPIGAAVSTDQANALRVDAYVPKSLVQSLVAAGMQAQMQMQGGGAGGPRGGGL